MDPRARFTERIWELDERVEREREAFDPPANPPNEDRAMTFLREGAGPAISLFVEARTGQHMIQFDPEAYEALEEAMNEWLELYAACYGQDIVADYALREAAQLLIDTHNIRDVAEVLTQVPAE
jgi:hypothetical protein